jgi:hypothetical protein
MPSIVFWESLRTGRFDSVEGGDSARHLWMRAAQSRRRLKLVRRAKEKVADRAILYEFHYHDVNWYVEQNRNPKLIDGLLNLVHKEWIDSDADEVGPRGPKGAKGAYWIRIAIVDVPVMREKAPEIPAGAPARGLEGENFSPRLRAKLAKLNPEQREEVIIGVFSDYAADYSEKVKSLADRLVALAEASRPPSRERTLDALAAEKRTGFSRSQLTSLGRAGILGEQRDGHWWFSEYELDHYMENRPRRGPRPKTAAEKTTGN